MTTKTIKKPTTAKKPVAKARAKSTPKKLKYNPNFATHKYALALIAGDIPCCKAEKQLAQKHVKDLNRQGTKAFPYVFDESRAIQFFRFYERCRNLDTGGFYEILPHLMFDNGMLYGWVRKDNGNRRFIKCYKQEAKAQAKTTSCAIKAMYALIADKIYPPNKPELGYTVPNASIQLMAVDRIQAEELREPIVAISQNSPKIAHFINAKQSYIKGKHGGHIVVLSKEHKAQQGSKPTYVIIDELSSHADAKRATIAENNLGKKGQVLLEIITTAGDNEMSNPAKKEYDYAKKILSGEITTDETYLPIIREVEDGDDIHNTEVWSKSHPMFRYCGKYAYADNLFVTIKKQYDRAYQNDDADLKRFFAIYRLNRWQERAVNSYLNQKQIEQLEKLAVSRQEWERLTYGKTKIVGLDFSTRRDLTADGEVYLLDDGRIAIDAHGYLLQDLLVEKEQSDKVTYSDWAKQGYLTVLDNSYAVIDKDIVANDIIARAEANEQEIKELCYDPYKAKDLAQDLIKGKYGGGFNEDNVLQVDQDIKNLVIPTEKLKNLIITEQLVWNGNPLLKWCFMNCYTTTVTSGKIIDGVKVKKENKDSPRRIDLVAAIITAMKRVESLEQSNNTLQAALYSGNFRFS